MLRLRPARRLAVRLLAVRGRLPEERIAVIGLRRIPELRLLAPPKHGLRLLTPLRAVPPAHALSGRVRVPSGRPVFRRRRLDHDSLPRRGAGAALSHLGDASKAPEECREPESDVVLLSACCAGPDRQRPGDQRRLLMLHIDGS